MIALGPLPGMQEPKFTRLRGLKSWLRMKGGR